MYFKQEHPVVIIDDEAIYTELQKAASSCSEAHVREILLKSLEMKGLDAGDVATLICIDDSMLLEELFNTALKIKESIYGRRIVLFAPLHISNLCTNECLYCAFRVQNQEIKRFHLSQDEIAREVRILVEQGHKHILLECGEADSAEGVQYVLDAIDTIYSTHSGNGEIRHCNVNVAPLSIEDFHKLKARGIGTYQLFQETYHYPTYDIVHVSGKKKDYNWHITAIDRALKAGIDDVGIGVLFGLYDWRFEILSIMQHIKHLENHFGVGPHTFSVRRLEPALGSSISTSPTYAVSDSNFLKLVAILRLAIPYTEIIMSTHESVEIRSKTLALGISQISTGSRTSPGEYSSDSLDASQSTRGDHRTLDKVISDLAYFGYIPSFCTSCYRRGRTGKDFMDLAKHGDIKLYCNPNAISTFAEYLEDYASFETRHLGEAAILKSMSEMEEKPRRRSEALLTRIKKGERDIFY